MNDKKLNDFIKLLPVFTPSKWLIHWKRMATQLYLIRNKKEREHFLKYELKSTIERITMLSDMPLFETIMSKGGIADAECSFVDEYISFFRKDKKMSYCRQQIIDFVLKGEEDVKNIGLTGFDPLQSYILKGYERISKMKGMETFLETYNELYYLDIIYQNLESVNKDQPLVFPKGYKSKTLEIITNSFESYHEDGWQAIFKSEEEYNYYCELLTRFFDGKDDGSTDVVIEMQPNSITKTAAVLGSIRKYFSRGTLKKDKEFFKVVRVLRVFRELSDEMLAEKLRPR